MRLISSGLAPALTALLAVAMSSAHATVKLNGLFTNGAVLQRDIAIPVWGTAASGEKVTVTLRGQKVSAVARNGRWLVRLRPLAAGGPFAMTVAGRNRISLSNILVGEVYLCSGQSNMEWPLSLAANAAEIVPVSADPMLRLYTVPKTFSDTLLREVRGEWRPATPESTRSFSAVAYFFGRSLRRHLGVPVGLIQSTWGGTPAQAWTSRAALESNPTLQPIIAEYDQAKTDYRQALMEIEAAHKAEAVGTEATAPQAAGYRAPANPTNQNSPATLYNAMIAPLIPYAVRGAIWYQGESNVGAAYQYQTLFPAMIRDWRAQWKEGDFPFFFVQLAPFMKKQDEPQDSAWAELREAQRLTSLNVTNTGMAVITDIGDEESIDPPAKQEVGERLALLARAMVYKQEVEEYGPVHDSMRIEGAKIILQFQHTGGGLQARDGDGLRGFTIAGRDGQFYNAVAVIRGDTVVVSSPQVAQPVAVRYGWANYPQGNLWNRAGLPASPFRTDNLPLTTQPK